MVRGGVGGSGEGHAVRWSGRELGALVVELVSQLVDGQVWWTASGSEAGGG